MKDELSSKKGTIANVFSKKRNEIFELINNDDYIKLQSLINDLLNDKSLKGNNAVEEAKQTLNRCARKKNLYYSTLMTYMTGMKVS